VAEEGKLIFYLTERITDDHKQSDGAIDQPVAGDSAINRFRSILIVSEIADITAFYFIDAKQKDKEDNRVDKGFLEMHRYWL
jgi:hypothetical protein